MRQWENHYKQCRLACLHKRPVAQISVRELSLWKNRKMRFFKSTGTVLLVAALSYLLSANASTIPLPKNPLLLRPSNSSLAYSLNRTSLGEWPDPRFSVTYALGTVNLRSTSLLINGIDALAVLAVEDPTARKAGWHYHSASYSDVYIDVAPEPPATDVLNDIAIPCITAGLINAMRFRRFKNTEIQCQWDEVTVARVSFEPAGESSSNATEALSLPADDPGGSGNSSSLINTTHLNDTRLELVAAGFFFPPNSQTTSVEAVFFNAIMTLASFAYYPSTELIHDAAVRATNYDTYIHFEQAETRTQPPFFEYRWAIEAVRELPRFMLRQRRFAEVGIGISVDDVLVGQGYFSKGTPPDGVPAEVASA